MKKITALLLMLIISISAFSVNASAFGGYAHWYMGVKKGDSYGNTKSDEVKLAYASGCLLADIGYNRLDDKIGYNSDKYDFIKKMYTVSRKLNTRSRCMAYGWRDHYTQDWLGSIESMNPPKLTDKAGWVDEYLRDVWKPIDFPIQDNEIGEIYIGYTLIKKTYEEFGLKLENDDIDKEIIGMFVDFDIQIGWNIQDWSPAQEEAIKNELDRTINICTGIAAKVPEPIYVSTSLSENVSGIDKSFSEYMAGVKKTRTDVIMNSITDDELSEITKYIDFEKEYISEDEAILKVTKTDEKAYNAAIKDLIEYKIDNYSDLAIA